MGYCMSQINCHFNLPKSNHAAALKAIQSLTGKETCVDSSGKHFSWVDSGFEKINNLDDMLIKWRYQPLKNADGDITALSFTGEKYGDCLVMFEAIAPFVMKDSYIEMQGEDGNRWKWVFDGQQCKEISGRWAYEQN